VRNSDWRCRRSCQISGAALRRCVGAGSRRRVVVYCGAGGGRLVLPRLVATSAKPARAENQRTECCRGHDRSAWPRRDWVDSLRSCGAQRCQCERVRAIVTLCARLDRLDRNQADATALCRVSHFFVQLGFVDAVYSEWRGGAGMVGNSRATVVSLSCWLCATLFRPHADIASHCSGHRGGAGPDRSGSAVIAAQASPFHQDDRRPCAVWHLL
jgi:hypothetical protein